MQTRELLLQNYQFTAFVLERNLEGLEQAECLERPTGGSSVDWVLGHIVVSRNHVLGLLGEPPLLGEGEGAHYQRGSQPAPEAALPLSELLETYRRSQQLLMARLEKLSEQELEAHAANVLTGEDSTVGLQLAALNFHEAYHCGQLGVLRRALGKPGGLS